MTNTPTIQEIHRNAVGAPDDMERCPIAPTYGPSRVQFVRGQGSYLFDRFDTRYVDFLSGLAVTSLGHSHPEVAEAVSAQALRLQHVSNLFATEHCGDVSIAIDRAIGDGTQAGGQTFFANSGAEANEAAIKLARKWGGHGRHAVLSAFQSFHGRTLATLHATGQPSKWEAFQPLPEGFKHAVWNDIADFERVMDDTVAAILIEPVQGEGGVNPATKEFLQGIRRLCDERGALMMVDEVQTGLGRTGRWFGFQHFDVKPDVVTMAKALGNGMPIGACWATAEAAASFRAGDHATTYGGQPLATSAAKAVLEIMERIDAPALSAAAGAKLTDAVMALPQVSGVRGLGMLLAVELVGCEAPAVAARCLERGLVLNGVTPTALRMAPPLVISDEEIAEGVAILAGVLEEMAS